jgi:hypothetical protein
MTKKDFEQLSLNAAHEYAEQMRQNASHAIESLKEENCG